MSYADRPTFSFVPLDDAEFTRKLFTPLTLDGVLYLARDGRARDVELPGLRVTARPGAGPLDGDIPLPGGLYQASRGRALAENSRPSRSRAGRARRTLDTAELGDWVDRLCQSDGPQRLARWMQQLVPERRGLGEVLVLKLGLRLGREAGAGGGRRVERFLHRGIIVAEAQILPGNAWFSWRSHGCTSSS